MQFHSRRHTLFLFPTQTSPTKRDIQRIRSVKTTQILIEKKIGEMFGQQIAVKGSHAKHYRYNIFSAVSQCSASLSIATSGNISRHKRQQSFWWT